MFHKRIGIVGAALGALVLAGTIAQVHADPAKMAVAHLVGASKPSALKIKARPGPLSPAELKAHKDKAAAGAGKAPAGSSGPVAHFDLSSANPLKSGGSFITAQFSWYVNPQEGGNTGSIAFLPSSGISVANNPLLGVDFEGLTPGSAYMIDATVAFETAGGPVFFDFFGDKPSESQVNAGADGHAVFAFIASTASTRLSLRSSQVWYLFALDLHKVT